MSQTGSMAKVTLYCHSYGCQYYALCYITSNLMNDTFAIYILYQTEMKSEISPDEVHKENVIHVNFILSPYFSLNDFWTITARY